MEFHEFKVTRHYLELETAWRADFSHGSGGRTIGINSEMDGKLSLMTHYTLPAIISLASRLATEL